MRRRSLLAMFGATAAGGIAVAAGVEAGVNVGESDEDAADGRAADLEPFSVAQGDRCTTVVPLVGDDPVEEFYDYRLPRQYDGDGVTDAEEGPFYESLGTVDLQREDTTVSFLYLGPDGLSLVVVHDSAERRDEGTGGSVTWTVENVPRDAEWAVKDDLYVDPGTGESAGTNYDRWAVDGDAHTVDWTWGSSGTDGGVLRTGDRTVDLTIRPAYNEASAMWGEHYETDRIEQWEFLSFPGGAGDPLRTDLSLDEPVHVRTGQCGIDAAREEVALDLDIHFASLDLYRKGVVSVGLGLPSDLEPADLDVESLRFGAPERVADGGGARPIDADDEPVVRYRWDDTGLELGDTEAHMVGRTVDGRPVVGATGF